MPDTLPDRQPPDQTPNPAGEIDRLTTLLRQDVRAAQSSRYPAERADLLADAREQIAALADAWAALAPPATVVAAAADRIAYLTHTLIRAAETCSPEIRTRALLTARQHLAALDGLLAAHQLAGQDAAVDGAR